MSGEDSYTSRPTSLDPHTMHTCWQTPGFLIELSLLHRVIGSSEIRTPITYVLTVPKQQEKIKNSHGKQEWWLSGHLAMGIKIKKALKI